MDKLDSQALPTVWILSCVKNNYKEFKVQYRSEISVPKYTQNTRMRMRIYAYAYAYAYMRVYSVCAYAH